MDNRESSSQNLNLTNIKYLSLSQAGEIFNYTRQHLSLLIRLNKLKAVKIGNFYYTTEEWVKDYINNLDKSKTDETKFDPVLKLLKQSLLQRDLSLPIFKIVWTFFILVIGFYLFNYKPIETLAFFSKPQKFLTKAIDLTDKLAYSYIAQVHDLLYLGLDIYKPTNLTDFGETLSANVVTLVDNLVASEVMDAVHMRVTTNISEVFSFRALANIKTFFSANKFLDKKDTNHQLEYNLSALIKFINQKINEKNKELEALENSLTLLENKLKIITANQPITTFNFNSDVSSSKSSNITSVGTLSIDRRISDIEASLKILNKRVSPSTSFLEELWIIKQNYANLNSELIQLKNLTEKLQEKQRSIPLPIFAYQAAPVVVSPAANISGIIGAVKNAFEDSSLAPRQIKVGDLTLSGKNISSLSAILPDSALLTLNGSLIPATTTTYDLGSSSNKWNTIYAQSLAVNSLSSSGQQIITYQPASSSITESSMYINPVSATSTFPLLGVAINGNEKLRVNANGDLTIQGILTIMGSATSTFGGPVLLATTTVSRLTISELTNGSILFAGSGGIISQDNSQLFWDNTNNRLGIGTTTPTERLTVSGNILGTGNLTIQGTTTLGNLNGVLKASSGTVSGGATTSDLPEGTNLYYTDARARSALSGLAPISYNSSTGVISLATPLATQYGGTGQNWSSVATGSLPYFSGTGILSTLAIGSTNQILTVSSGLPVWTSTPTLATTTITTQLSVPTITTASGALSISPASNATTTISGPTILAGTTGNVGIGTTAPSYPLTLDNTFTGTSGTISSSGITARFNPASATTATNSALFAQSIVNAGNAQNFSNMFGMYFNIENFGSGTITLATGLQGKVNNRDVGTITTAKGLYSVINNLSTGTITTGIGLHVDAPSNSGGGTFTNYYGLYVSASTAATNNYGAYIGGNVGIGTTAPATNLHIQVSDGVGVNTNDVLRLGRSGADSVGDTTRLSFAASTDLYATIDSIVSAAGTGDLAFSTRNAGVLNEKIRITGAGNVGIGTTAPNEKLEVAGRIRMTTWIADGDTAVYRDDPTGNLGLITSDIRLKKDLEAISGAEALDIIRQIGAYKYRDIDADENSKKKYGVIAQELLNLAPELTFTFRNTDSQEEYFSVHYDKLPVLLLAGIKEQQKQIEELKLSINQNGNLTQDGQEVNRQLSTNNSQSIFNDLISKLKDALASLGLFVENGIAKIKEIIAQKITTKEICLEGEDGEKICIDKNQLKELLQKNNLNPSQPNSTSEITPNLYSQPSPTPSLSPSSETTPTTSSESSPSQIPEITPTSTLLSPPEATPTTSPEITPSPSTTIEATSISSPQPLSTPIPQPTSLPEPTFLPSSATAEQ